MDEFTGEEIQSFVAKFGETKPNSVAVSFEQQNLTYAQLNRSANAVAHWLRMKGLGPEDRIAVCLRPGLDHIVALLGILKAGATYLPINYEYPSARIATICADAQPVITVAEEDFIKDLSSVLISPMTLQEILAYASGQLNDIECYQGPIRSTGFGPSTTAYIFYTSGTTGTPKGIAISYQGLSYYILSAIDQFSINEQDNLVTIAKYSFSISLFDLLTTVSSGGTLTILSRDEIMNFGRLATALQDATIAHVGPNILKGLLWQIKKHYPSCEPFRQMRHISSGGDFVPVEVLRDLQTVFSQAEVYVIYGCTEIACMGCCFLAPRDDSLIRSYIGKPFRGMSLALLSEEGTVIADQDTSGEICFSGPGVMLGYVNRPELTERAFITIDGKRYFRTGDIGRIDHTGNVEYLGRRDFQIKLRGQRIELLDIESHLRQAPGVRDAVVATAELPGREKFLVAYLVGEIELGAVRGYLASQLPEYMQPTGWIVLDKMPLNENFKISRKSLPTPTADNLVLSERYVAPRNEAEKLLTSIWQEVLGVPSVGILDCFRNIGGDSLSAMYICSLAEEHGLHFSPTMLSSHPTIAELAGAIAAKADEIEFINPELKICDPEIYDRGDIPALPPFMVDFLSGRGASMPHRWNISRLVELRRRVAPEILESAYRKLGQTHDALRLRFFPTEQGWQAEILQDCATTLNWQFSPLVSIAPESRERVINEIARTAQEAIDLATGPIASMILFDFGDQEPQKIYLVFHHFVMDVISWNSFWQELELLCTKMEIASSNGENSMVLNQSPRSPRGVSFRSWSHVLRSLADSQVTEEAARKWIDQPWDTIVALPRDLPGLSSDNLNSFAEVVSLSFSVPSSSRITLLEDKGVNFETVLLASLGSVLCDWRQGWNGHSGGSSTVLFDRLVHGRSVCPSDWELTRTIGCLVSYSPTTLTLDLKAEPLSILTSVAGQMADWGNQGCQVELARHLSTNAGLVSDLQRLPAAELLFNYRGNLDGVFNRSRLFGSPKQLSRLDHNPNGQRRYPIAMSVDIKGADLQMHCVFCSKMHQRETISVLCNQFQERIRTFLLA